MLLTPLHHVTNYHTFVCNDVLLAESMKPNQLERHFYTKHQNFQIRMYSILKTKLMASRKADLMQVRYHDNSSADILSTTLSLQTFRLQIFRLLLYTRVQDSYTSNFCFSKSLFSSIPTSTYTRIPFINPTSTDAMIIQHI